jgi:phospholipid/cholesterol/gamma-HCH transport system substrate-binding protein
MVREKIGKSFKIFNMKSKKEIYIGLISIIAIAGLVVGFYFLKGQEIWKSRYVYYAYYNNTEGLNTGRPVNLNGLQVGIVTNVSFELNDISKVLVEFELNDPIMKQIPIGSKVILNSDLLSGAYLDILWKDSAAYHSLNDTIPSSVSLALEDQINERLLPLEKKTNELISTADSAIKTIEAIFSRNTDNLDQSFDGIRKAINNFERVSLRVDTLIMAEKYRISKILANVESITGNLKENNEEIKKVLFNVAEITDSLSKTDIVGTVDNVKSSLEKVNMILYDVQNGDGTLTHLIQDSLMYFQFVQMLDEATRLIENVKTHPNRYLQFSLLGGKNKSILDARDEKLLKKFAKDSLTK